MGTFAKVMKVINYTRLWDAKFPWYSPNATCWICFDGWEFGLSIFAGLLRFLKPKKNFLNHLVTVLQSTEPSPFSHKCFWSLLQCYGPVWSCKTEVPKLDILNICLSGFQIMKWSNVLCITTLTTTILPTKSGTFCDKHLWPWYTYTAN